MRLKLLFIQGFILLALYGVCGDLLANGSRNFKDPYQTFYTELDTLPPIRERQGDFINGGRGSVFDLQDPKIINKGVEFDPKTGNYILTETIDSQMYRPSTFMTFDEYFKSKNEEEDKKYFKQLSELNRVKAGADPIIPYKDRISKGLVDRLFCGSEIDVRPQGNIDLTFGGDYQKIANPILTERQQRQGGFDFNMNIQMNVVGTIGKKLKLTFNYNTQATFDFDRQVKVEYLADTECSEDDILKKIEVGNVSFPLRSSLIQGRQRLFGVRTDWQFGRLKISAVASQSQTQRKEIQIQGGAQQQTFEVQANRYDENRHFFLSHYNRDAYEPALTNLPQVNSLINITKLEVWVTNDRNVTEGVRDVVAFADLGETDPSKMIDPSLLSSATEFGADLYGKRLPDRNANGLYAALLANPQARGLPTVINTLQNSFGMNDSEDFSKIRARKLAASEYTFHPKLGFISLNVNVKPTDVVGVAYQYTYNGKTYQVGEFAQDLPIDSDTLNVMYLKMLKGVRTRVDLPIWDLMMKNVYSLNAYQINPEDFRLDVLYQDPGGGTKRFIPEGPVAGKPLLTMLNLDNLNRALDPFPDGQFDFVSGLTILPTNGRMIFPVLEPFGSTLEKKFRTDPNNPASVHPLARKYVYQQLYDSTITIAGQFPEFNRYVIKGTYKSSVSSEISLGGFNIPKGSVVVSAGGATLVEGTDYTIDYNLGRVKILNESYLNSGQPIRVTFEDNSQFGFNRQSFFGTRLDYYINDKFNIGGTFLHLLERPFTQKVNYGDDPMSNSIYGFDVQYATQVPWLTRLVDKLPLYSTKAPSNFSFTGEFAHLLPGSPKVINMGLDKDAGGTVYIDDFEGSGANFNLAIPTLQWVLASTPRTSLFPEANLSNDLDYNSRRSKIQWYQLDPDLASRAQNVSTADKKSIYVAQLRIQDVFKNTQLQQNQNNLLRTFDIAYYPQLRGPYNFSTDNIDPATGQFTNPSQRWGGIMRSLQNNDFEANNIELMEIWVMSPFKEGRGGNGGDLYIELGDVSEDILKDSRLFFENGLADSSSGQRTDTTTWSRIPRSQAVTNAFDNDPAIRAKQDIGLDGFDDDGERVKFKPYLDSLAAVLGTNNPVYQAAEADPAGDNFIYFRDSAYDQAPNPPAGRNAIIWRYDKYNNPQGNSSQEPDNTNQTISTSTNVPDNEDINRDNTLNEEEAFYQYKIPIRRTGLNNDEVASSAYMTDAVAYAYDGPNGTDSVYFYQFKIPVDQFTNVVGNMQGFRSIRFARMYMTGFSDETVMRFARLDLIRNQWRRYIRPLTEAGVYIPTENANETSFDVNAVNFEENSDKTPFNYVLPPGVQREQAIGALNNALQNEQSLLLNVCNLQDGDARAANKIINMDMRVYERLKMFVHAENVAGYPVNNQGDISLFLRIGSDFENNYYEYEIPLTMSDPLADPSEPTNVWLEANMIDFPLSLLSTIKLQRQAAGHNISVPFAINDPNKPANLVKIIGNPELGLVKGMMIGVRNRKDDGIARCVEVWANELRLTGFDERGGMAGIGRADLQIADLGNLTMSGSFRTIGFGSIEQRVNQRSRERSIMYDITTSVALDKFLPKEWKVRLPFFAQYSKDVRTPEYDPYQLDIRLRDLLNATLDGTVRDSLREQAQTIRTISSFNFTNVKKERTSKIALPFDISNFNFTYAQTRNLLQTPLIRSEERTENRLVIEYAYAIPMKPIFPLKKLLGKPNKWLAIIQDINIKPLPNSIGVRSEMLRRFGETKYRFADDATSTWYDKKFSWDRSYNLQWDLTQSIKINFTATNNGIVDEPYGRWDSQEKRDTIWQNIQNLGRNKAYQHNAVASYTLPLKKIPVLDWIDVKAQYQTNFNWAVASLNTDSLGNILGNSQNRQVNADFSFDKFYAKSKFLKKISTPAAPNAGKANTDRDVKGKNGQPDDKIDPNDPDAGKGKGKKKNNEPSPTMRALIRPLLLVQRARFTYTEDFTTILPGMNVAHKYLGQSSDLSRPGLDFAFGMQPTTQWLDNAANKGWVTTNIFQNQQVQQTHKVDYSGKVNLIPFTDFNIEVDINKTLSETFTENFKVDTFGGSFRHLNPMRIGTTSMSYLPIKTWRDSEGSYGKNSSANFDNFADNRQIISNRLGSGIHDDTSANIGYTNGYGRYQQDVLLNAFIMSYTGKDVATANIIKDVRNLIPAPNWRLTYNGLQKLKAFKKIFTSFNLTHGYKSTLTVNRFATDLDYQNNPEQKDQNSKNFYSTFEVPDVLISEQFNPLLGLDVRFVNDLSARVNYKSSRNLAMSFNDYTLAATTTEELTVGLGYRIKNLKAKDIFKPKKGKNNPDKDPKKKDPDNDNYFNFGKTIPKHEWNIQFDFSYRNDATVNHILDQRNSQATRGMRTLRIAPSIDYIVNNRMTIRAFYDFSSTTPRVSNAFPVTNMKGGVTLRFSLAQ